MKMPNEKEKLEHQKVYFQKRIADINANRSKTASAPEIAIYDYDISFYENKIKAIDEQLEALRKNQS